jgi:DNA-binding response OmpR family regulator
MKAQRVLVVDDDAELRAYYARLFERLRPEWEAVVVGDGEHALDVLQSEPVDLVLLDWRLPGISGVSLAKAMREHPRTRGLPILMVTAKSTGTDEVAALEAGADDHLAKPFDEQVLLARLRSLTRRRLREFTREQAGRFPGLDLDLEAGRLRVDGEPVHLTPKEMDLLAIFLQRPGMIHARAFLWQSLWDYESDLWDHVLVSTISSLRRKLGPKWGARLQAHKGKGYSFEA